MVACSHHYFYDYTGGFTHFWRQHSRSAIYLFFVLMKWKTKHTSLAVIAVGFGLFYFLLHKNWMLVPIGLVLIGFVIAPVGEWIHRGWMLLAKVLGWINSRILLTVLFFVILTPVALLARLLGKTSIQLKPGNTKSRFTIRNHRYKKEDLEFPW